MHFMVAIVLYLQMYRQHVDYFNEQCIYLPFSVQLNILTSYYIYEKEIFLEDCGYFRAQ